ncbi:MAG: MerR family transcriptional regulator, partial [Candidatus Aureabacteria bacterium]|nr:MerR family transcriptional regulator [Candidatus Auribacterota bacterium]
MKRKYISAKEVIDKYKISYSLLNYYTNMGLFKVEKRNGNMRLYDEKEI